MNNQQSQINIKFSADLPALMQLCAQVYKMGWDRSFQTFTDKTILQKTDKEVGKIRQQVFIDDMGSVEQSLVDLFKVSSQNVAKKPEEKIIIPK